MKKIKLQIKDVVKTAAIVPLGILREGSFKSPERFDPAIMPVTEGKNIPNSIRNEVTSSPRISVFSRPFLPGFTSPSLI